MDLGEESKHKMEKRITNIIIKIKKIVTALNTKIFIIFLIEVDFINENHVLNTLRNKNSEMVIIGHLNINHVEKKFEPFVSLVKEKLDIILLSETKIDESFPSSQFAIEGYTKPFRRDRDIHGGGILIYVRDDIPCKEVKSQGLPEDIECVFIEINLRNKK